jgi:hypothetical protein
MGLYQILTDPQNFKFYAEKSFPNVNAVSNATSFGQKSIGYGDSNQPYIQIAPPPVVGPTTGNGLQKLEDNIRYNSQSWGPDFLTRGNLFGAVRTADDVKRLTKYFFDTKSINGYLFLAKQNLLSRLSPATEASTGLAYGLGALNAGIYTPASTIGQAAVSLIEGHLLKQGIDPTGTVQSLSIKNYQQALYTNQLKEGANFEKNNRLIKLSKLSYYTEAEAESLNSLISSPYKVRQNPNFFMSYGGGPDSVLGIGPTRIKYATDNTGETRSVTISNRTGLNTIMYFDAPTPMTWDRKDLSQVDININDVILEDFRKKLLANATPGQQTFLSISPSYKLDANVSGSSTTGNIEKRTNFRGAGARGNRKNYQEGKKNITSGKVLGPTDIINAVPIYQGESPSTNDILKDMIDFNIGIYDNDTIGESQTIQTNWIHFRVLLDEFSDSYGSDWKAISYMGRAENFYKYESFKRDISIGFTVAAQSKQELLPIYKKLNYLASSLAPSYSKNGFIRGNLAQITLGDWLREQPGFISSVDLSIPEDSPWEINLPIDGNKTNTDSTVKQVPHMVNVKIKFTPIHKFRPEINKLSNLQDVSKFSEDNILTQDPTYGPQRFIALEDKNGNGYDPSNKTTKEQENPSAVKSGPQQNEISPR